MSKLTLLHFILPLLSEIPFVLFFEVGTHKKHLLSCEVNSIPGLTDPLTKTSLFWNLSALVFQEEETDDGQNGINDCENKFKVRKSHLLRNEVSAGR